MGAFMSYVLVPRQHDTRLLLKVVMQTNRWAALGLSVGDLIMARRQLLNLKRLAERQQGQPRIDGQPQGERACAEVCQTVGVRYERYEPAAALRDVAEHYWLVVAPPPPATVRAVLVPNGRATVQFCLGSAGVRINAAGERTRNADVFLPATSEPMVLEQDGASHYVGIQFTAWGARRLWPGSGLSPRPVAGLVDRIPPAADLADIPGPRA